MSPFFDSPKTKKRRRRTTGNPWLPALATYLFILAAARGLGVESELTRAYNAVYPRLGGMASTQCISWFESIAITWHVELMPAALAIVFFGSGLQVKRSLFSLAAVAGTFTVFWGVQLLLLGDGTCEWDFQSRSLWLCVAAGAASAAVSMARPGAKYLASPRTAAVAALACALACALLWFSSFDWHKFDPYTFHLFTANEYKVMEFASVAASLALGLALGFARGRLTGERGAARAIATACLLGFLSCIFFLAVPLSGISHDSMDIVLTHAWLWPLFLLLA